ncbi:hypothetical protein [Roseivirga sp.]|uniref:hypothetical protein n=1 Tax=Roseivirga sp. TaxID=1964215 RepID=UPI003B51C769
MKNKKPSLRFPIMLSLTLGLAPFVPEPHIVGKIRWIWGGAVGMGPMDYFDIILHGSPWVYLIYSLVLYARNSSKNTETIKR